jgi:hypothetical protein
VQPLQEGCKVNVAAMMETNQGFGCTYGGSIESNGVPYLTCTPAHLREDSGIELYCIVQLYLIVDPVPSNCFASKAVTSHQLLSTVLQVWLYYRQSIIDDDEEDVLIPRSSRALPLVLHRWLPQPIVSQCVPMDNTRVNWAIYTRQVNHNAIPACILL